MPQTKSQHDIKQDTLSPDLEWQMQPIGFKNSRLFTPIMLLGTLILLNTVFNLLVLNQTPINTSVHTYFTLFFLVSGLVLLMQIAFLIRHDLLAPFIHLRNWAKQMKEKDYSSRLPAPKKGEFSKLATDINSLSEKLQMYSDEFQQEVDKQTHQVEEKNRSLNILYEVATAINRSKNLDDLLSRFLHVLIRLTGAKAGTVRLRTADDQLKMVASVGLNKSFVEEEQMVPITRCLCGTALINGSVETRINTIECSKLSGQPLFRGQDAEIIAVPLEHQGVHLGVYNLFIIHEEQNHEDRSELLTSIGKHLGMAIEKARLDKDSRLHSIMKERTLLAHELHDSLAQTLASLRFQATILEENILEDLPIERDEITRLHESIDEAYKEVRGLITHFRAPMDNLGLIPAFEKMIANFETSSNIPVFFQNEWNLELKSEQEFQIIRIVQEALTNIRKHSKARTVRLLVRSPKNALNEILIEDDGIGINNKNLNSSIGEHIGLSVMQERAVRLGGKINIETETGEGTQILLTFPNEPVPEKTVKFM